MKLAALRMGARHSFAANEDGATAVVFVLALPVLIGAVAMAVEIGHWRQTQARLQTMADMAAIAGARELMLTNSGGEITVAAKGEAYENGFVFADGSVKVYSPPQTGKYSGKEGVEVVIEEEKSRYFTKIFNQSPVAYSARATALLVDGDPACVLTLNGTASQSLKVSGSASVNVNGCVAHANSTASDAFAIGGSGSMTVACATSAGGFSSPGSITTTDCDTPETSQPIVKDPYADVSVPANVSSMACQTPVATGKWSRYLPVDSVTKVGRYCSDVTFVDLIQLEQGGTYIFDGADLTIKSQFAELRGKEITLIFMNGGKFSIANGGMIDITAKSTGPYAGILFYGDRDTSNPGDVVQINGNQNAKMEGVFYFPSQDVKFNGGAALASSCTHIIAQNVEFTGNAAMNNTNCDAVGAREIGGSSGVALFE